METYSSGPGNAAPALLTRPKNGPGGGHPSCCTLDFSEIGEVEGNRSDAPPNPSRRSVASFFGSSRCPKRRTPCRRSALTVARPITLDAPVTRTVRLGS